MVKISLGQNPIHRSLKFYKLTSPFKIADNTKDSFELSYGQVSNQDKNDVWLGNNNTNSQVP